MPKPSTSLKNNSPKFPTRPIPATPIPTTPIPAIALALLLGGCGGQVVRFPFDPAGRNPKSLNSAYAELTPAAAGRFVVFTSDRNGSQDVYLYDVRDRQTLPLPGLNALDAIATTPSISEDGNWIVFAANRQGRTSIFLYNRSTEQLRELTPTLKADVRNPTIDADAERIAFEINRNGQWDLAIIDRTGREIPVP